MSRDRFHWFDSGLKNTPVRSMIVKPSAVTGFSILRADQLFILMGAARQPAQDVFGGEDGECRCLHRAVDGGDEHQAAGADHLRAGGHEEFDVGDVFDHFHVQHDIEGLAGFGQLLGRHGAVIDRHARGLRMRGGDADVLFGGVGADDRRAHAGHRLGQQAAAAADIEDPQPFSGRALRTSRPKFSAALSLI
jgi:hypothetical protein